MFISTYANQTTFILYIFILTLFYVWHGICGGGQIIIILQIFISKKKSMRRVRLTEGQLHNVIRESVNQILNELDWKTYASAARKKNDQMKNPDDSDEFSREVSPLMSASSKAVFRKYPHLKSVFNKLESYEPLTPEEQEEYAAFEKDFHNCYKYKYEKGGRGYYLDEY